MRNPPAPAAGRLLGRRSLLAAGLAAGLATGRRSPAFVDTSPWRKTVAFVPGSADPHGLEVRDGSLYVCDAGIGPGFVPTPSPPARFVCRVEFV